MDKKKIRKEILNIRNSLEKRIKESYDDKIFNCFIESELYKNSNNIFIYVSYGSEVNTIKLIERFLKDKKKVFVPKINFSTKEMFAIKIESLDILVENKMGILEPKYLDRYIKQDDLDIILMPGAVFDLQGNRIGYGGGYYDRYLKNTDKNNKIALAYSLQLAEEIPCESHDIKVDYIVTEKNIKKI